MLKRISILFLYVFSGDLKLDGHNIEEIIRSDSAESKYGVVHWMWQRDWMVREGDWKLYRDKLLNLADEEPERKDYSREKPELKERLKRLHEEWVKEVMPAKAPKAK